MGFLENSFPEYVLFTQIDKAINWARASSLHYLTMDLSCCGIEMLQVSGGRFDIERFGTIEQSNYSHADLMIIAGSISTKAAPYIKEVYEKMPKPKYVMSLGSCANSGGMFRSKYSYCTIDGADKIVPVDVYVPGCPPRPEAILHGLLALQKKIKGQRVLVLDELKRTNGQI